MKDSVQRELEIEEALEEATADINVPWLYRWTKISHYYGDTVRQLFIGAAAIMLAGAPFYTDNLPTELPFIIIGTVVLVCIAAVTNPVKSAAIGADAVAAAVGLIIFEVWALIGYQNDPLYKFVIRETLAVIFLFALYFSTKTLRSMMLGQVGQVDSIHDPSRGHRHHLTDAQREHIDWKREAREKLDAFNDREKLEYND